MFATVSSWNHGQGFALACRLQRVNVPVVVPKPFSALKHRAVLGYGTQVHVFENWSCTDAMVRELVDGYQPVVIQPYTICS
jgi:threonine dehydratase